MKNDRAKDNKGITLIEVTLSLLIISIIFISVAKTLSSVSNLIITSNSKTDTINQLITCVSDDSITSEITNTESEISFDLNGSTLTFPIDYEIHTLNNLKLVTFNSKTKGVYYVWD